MSCKRSTLHDCFRKTIITCFMLMAVVPLYAVDAGITVNQDLESKTLVPVFPETNPNIVFVEGEDAISTNFDKEPRLNFGCSGRRTLQLAQSKEPTGGTSYYADYVFYVEEAGAYEIWYGGTPPGPKDTLSPSYTSPFEYEIDNSGSPVSVYRENDTVVLNYTPVYYWNAFAEQKLDKGMHTLRFTIKEKRRFDAKYYFYLDCFFLVRKESGRRMPGKPLPDVFPKNLDEKRLVKPFPSFDDCLIAIRDNPEDVEPLIEISRFYTLVGDHLSAVKYLKRAFTIDSENEDVLYLLAKNDIWRNETDEGLDFYSELLSIDPSKLDLWLEAGKVAGWIGKYDESADFFKKGLDEFPGNLDLLANLGLTYLWAGLKSDADDTFKRAKETASADARLLKQLGRTFVVSGYPDKAADCYKDAIAAAPADIEAYLLLAGVYYSMNRKDQAEKIKTRMATDFAQSERLNVYIDHYFEKLGLKEKAIAGYETRLAGNPDDLSFREMLSQAYFWSGRQRDAIFESLNILAYYLYRDLSRVDKSSLDCLEAIDKLSACRTFLSGLKDRLWNKQAELSSQTEKYRAALKANDDYVAGKKKAVDEGKAFMEPEKNPSETVVKEEAKLRSLLAWVDAVSAQFESVSASVAESTVKANEIVEKNGLEQKSFEKRIDQIDWVWDRESYRAELSDVSGRGFALAYNVLARIDLAEGAPGRALESVLLAKGSVSSPELDYSLFEAYLRTGELAKAQEQFDASRDTLRSYAPYTEELVSFLRSLRDDSSAAVNSYASAELIQKTGEAAYAISRLATREDALIQTVTDTSAGILAAYRQKMTRGFFTYEESTYLIRNELGDFFRNEDTARAIAQYKKVLAIDPWDIAALYRIGRAYDGNGQWQKAEEYYKRVFWADPSYENASELYNRIGREHADTIAVSATYLADTASVEWGVDAKYSIELNEVLGLAISYEGSNKRIYRWEKYQDKSIDNDYSYTVQSLILGIPLAFGSAGLKLTPSLGLDATLDDRFYDEEKNGFDSYGTSNITPFDFICFNDLYPEARLDFSFPAGSSVSVTGAAFFELQPETFGYLKKDVYEIGGTLNVGASLAAINVPVVKNTSFRVYGEGRYLFDTNTNAGFNIIWAGLGELSYTIVHTDEPAFTLSVFGNVYYQDSTIPADEYNKIDYYSPQDVFLAGGGFNMTSDIGLADGNVLGIGFSGGAFYATQFEQYSDPSVQQRLKIQADASFEYTRGNSTLYVKPELVMTPNLLTDSLWDYWDFYIAVGYTAKLPALLTQ